MLSRCLAVLLSSCLACSLPFPCPPPATRLTTPLKCSYCCHYSTLMNLTSSHDDDMPGQQQLLQLDKRSDPFPFSSSPASQTDRQTVTYVMQQGVLGVQGVCVCVWHMKLHVHVARNFALNGAGSRNSNKAKSRRRSQTETA